MSAGNWDMGTANNVTPSIVVDGDNVLQAIYPNNTRRFDMFYNGRTDLIDTEVDLDLKHISAASDGYAYHWFRCDGININTLNGTYVRIRNANWSIVKVVAGTPTNLHSGFTGIPIPNSWTRYRIRAWDLVFPAGSVKYSVDLWTGTWVPKATYIDPTGWLYGVGGRFGIGARYNAAYVTWRWNDIAIGEMS